MDKCLLTKMLSFTKVKQKSVIENKQRKLTSTMGDIKYWKKEHDLSKYSN